MKRKSPYSDGSDSTYRNTKPYTPLTTGIFQGTRGFFKRSINTSLPQVFLLSVFRECDYITLTHAKLTCKFWHNLISNPNNQKTFLYRSIQTGHIDFHVKNNNFRLARDLCTTAIKENKDPEYFTELNKDIIHDNRFSEQVRNLVFNIAARAHPACVPCLINILDEEIEDQDDIITLQSHFSELISIIFESINRRKDLFDKGVSIIIANIFLSLISYFSEDGKSKIAQIFETLLTTETHYTIFAKMVEQEFPFFLHVIKFLCEDSSLEVRGAAIIVAGLMAINFPQYQDAAWTLLFKTIEADLRLLGPINIAIEESYSTDKPSELDFSHEITLLLASNNKLFFSCIQNNKMEFIRFLQYLAGSKITLVKTSSVITLLMIMFNEELFDAHQRYNAIKNFKKEFKEDPHLLGNVINRIDSIEALTNLKLNMEKTFPEEMAELKRANTIHNTNNR